MKSTPALSDVLRRTIAECGIPLLTLERETGVVRASIMRFVRGDQSIRLDAADKLAHFFGLRLVADPGTSRRKAKPSRRARSNRKKT
jgi:plasmid maintenance system antidote protein VapI